MEIDNKVLVKIKINGNCSEQIITRKEYRNMALRYRRKIKLLRYMD